MSQVSDAIEHKAESHPFEVTAAIIRTEIAKATVSSSDTASGLSSGSIRNNLSLNDARGNDTGQNESCRSYRTDIFIGILFLVLMATLIVLILHISNTEEEINILKSNNNNLKDVIHGLDFKMGQIKGKDKSHDLHLSNPTNQTAVAMAFTDLMNMYAELVETNIVLETKVNNITEGLNDVTEMLTSTTNNATISEPSGNNGLKSELESPYYIEKSDVEFQVLAGRTRTLFEVPCAGTYFFYVVAAFVDDPQSNRIEMGSFSNVITTSQDRKYVGVYTKELDANDTVVIRNGGATVSLINKLTVNCHLIGICH